MKKNNHILLLISILGLTLPFAASAQTCEAYFPVSQGTTMELTSYDAKDKVSSIIQSSITAVRSEGEALIASVHAVLKDARGRDGRVMDYEVSCEGGVFKMDFGAMAAGGFPGQMEGMEMQIESDDLSIPRDLEAGTTLPDVSYSVKANMNGMTIMSMGMHSKNRKATKREQLTTPAGTFDCILIEADNESTGMGGMSFSNHEKTWYSLNTGIVRQESFRDNKLQSYQVLTKFSR